MPFLGDRNSAYSKVKRIFERIQHISNDAKLSLRVDPTHVGAGMQDHTAQANASQYGIQINTHGGVAGRFDRRDSY